MKPLSKQSERIRWKHGKERELAEFMKSHTEAGMTITEALKAFARENGISWLTARWKYYQMQRQKEGAARRDGTKVVRKPRKESTMTPDGQFIESLRQFIGASKASGVDILPLVRGLARFASLAEEGAKLRDRMEETEKEKRALEEELRRRTSQRGEFDEHLRLLVQRIDEWLAKNEVERVECLPEFSEALKRELGHVRRVIEPTA